MHRLGTLISLLAFAFATATTACKVSLECTPSQECIGGVCRVAGCTSSIECDKGQLCYPPGICATGTYVGEGENCVGNNRCWADLWCDYTVGTCKRYLDIGEQCTVGPADRCEPGAVCNLAGVCAYFGFEGPSWGKPCNATDQCLDEGFREGGRLVCRYGEFADLATGYPRWYLGGRICARPSANHFGENCVDDGDCGQGLHCQWGICLNAVVTARYAPDGFACQTGDTCCSQKCETRRSYRNGRRGQVRVCSLRDSSSPVLPGCPTGLIGDL